MNPIPSSACGSPSRTARGVDPSAHNVQTQRRVRVGYIRERASPGTIRASPLARQTADEKLVAAFQEALETEERHLERVRRWIFAGREVMRDD